MNVLNIIALIKPESTPTLIDRLQKLSIEINEDRYMLMEYLGPIVDGCRAAFNVSIEEAQNLEKITEHDFLKHMDITGDSFEDIIVCFESEDSGEQYAIIFDDGKAKVSDICEDANVIVSSKLDILLDLLDPDSKLSPLEILGISLEVSGNDPSRVVEGLGLLCYPSLLRMAMSGVDPSSLLSEEADAIILVTASDLVTKLLQKWIEIQLESS
jgi:hypothetical protein